MSLHVAGVKNSKAYDDYMRNKLNPHQDKEEADMKEIREVEKNVPIPARRGTSTPSRTIRVRETVFDRLEARMQGITSMSNVIEELLDKVE